MLETRVTPGTEGTCASLFNKGIEVLAAAVGTTPLIGTATAPAVPAAVGVTPPTGKAAAAAAPAAVGVTPPTREATAASAGAMHVFGAPNSVTHYDEYRRFASKCKTKMRTGTAIAEAYARGGAAATDAFQLFMKAIKSCCQRFANVSHKCVVTFVAFACCLCHQHFCLPEWRSLRSRGSSTEEENCIAEVQAGSLVPVLVL